MAHAGGGSLRPQESTLFDQGLEVLSPGECYRLLRLRSLGRVGLVVNGEPLVYPVRYRLVKGSVLFRAAAGTTLSAGTAGALVTFEADWFDDQAHQGWSVLAVGRALAVDADAPAGSGLRRPWAAGPHHLVQITPGAITGRRIQKGVILGHG